MGDLIILTRMVVKFPSVTVISREFDRVAW